MKAKTSLYHRKEERELTIDEFPAALLSVGLAPGMYTTFVVISSYELHVCMYEVNVAYYVFYVICYRFGVKGLLHTYMHTINIFFRTYIHP